MKKFLKIMSIALLIIAGAFVLTACFGGSELTQLERQLNSAVSNADKLDNVSEEDLSSNLLDSMDQESQKSSTSLPLSSVQNVATLREKFLQVREEHRAMKEKQATINANKAAIKVEVADIKATIKALKDAGYTLTDEDKATLKAYIGDIKTNVSNLRGTIGNVYYAIRGLRGHYRLANIDNVLNTIKRANEQLDIRVNVSEQLLTIFTNVDEFLKTKLA